MPKNYLCHFRPMLPIFAAVKTILKNSALSLFSNYDPLTSWKKFIQNQWVVTKKNSVQIVILVQFTHILGIKKKNSHFETFLIFFANFRKTKNFLGKMGFFFFLFHAQTGSKTDTQAGRQASRQVGRQEKNKKTLIYWLFKNKLSKMKQSIKLKAFQSKRLII